MNRIFEPATVDPGPPANKYTNKQTNKQINKQTNRQTKLKNKCFKIINKSIENPARNYVSLTGGGGERGGGGGRGRGKGARSEKRQ